jgi:hypothetical protein
MKVLSEFLIHLLHFVEITVFNLFHQIYPGLIIVSDASNLILCKKVLHLNFADFLIVDSASFLPIATFIKLVEQCKENYEP